ncbi:hypothetical protein L1987_03646 [Smallanthus sonchifolius]|uniref:Uncharacterized protein n=1 Tax=Smallanthus sonchifolius TaxID=185202 RepID=A0ACB9KBG7_9ASTR|nr:hypothetical protein L1987_03646 [Smallanthus sonchifolius]
MINRFLCSSLPIYAYKTINHEQAKGYIFLKTIPNHLPRTLKYNKTIYFQIGYSDPHVGVLISIHTFFHIVISQLGKDIVP